MRSSNATGLPGMLVVTVFSKCHLTDSILTHMNSSRYMVSAGDQYKLQVCTGCWVPGNVCECLMHVVLLVTW